jgi:hypothetical protein
LRLCDFIKKRRGDKLLEQQVREKSRREDSEKEVEHFYPYVIKWIKRQRIGVQTKKNISKKDLSRLLPDASEETQDALWKKLLREKEISEESDGESAYDDKTELNG